MSAGKIQIISAITWALTMLAIAYIEKATPQANLVFYILLAGSTTHMLMLAKLEEKRIDSDHCHINKTSKL